MDILGVLFFISSIFIAFIYFNKAMLHYKLIMMVRGDYEEESIKEIVDYLNYQEPSLLPTIFSLFLVNTYAANQEINYLKHKINLRVRTLWILLIVDLVIVIFTNLSN